MSADNLFQRVLSLMSEKPLHYLQKLHSYSVIDGRVDKMVVVGDFLTFLLHLLC